MSNSELPRTYPKWNKLLNDLIAEFKIDQRAIDSRNADIEMQKYAWYTCDICFKQWGSIFGFFHVNIKMSTIRCWGQCCRQCWGADRRSLIEATLYDDKMEQLLVRAIYSVIKKYHPKLLTNELENRYDEIKKEERNRIRRNSEKPEHDSALCERCSFGEKKYCMNKDR